MANVNVCSCRKAHRRTSRVTIHRHRIAAILRLGSIALLLSGSALAQSVEYLQRRESAPFSSVVRVGEILFVSGQIGIAPDGTMPDDFEGQVRQTMENLSEILRGAGSSLDDVFKCTVMLAEISRWEDFNRIYVRYFKENRLPARSAFGVNGLVAGALVELECAAYKPVVAGPEGNR